MKLFDALARVGGLRIALAALALGLFGITLVLQRFVAPT